MSRWKNLNPYWLLGLILTVQAIPLILNRGQLARGETFFILSKMQQFFAPPAWLNYLPLALGIISIALYLLIQKNKPSLFFLGLLIITPSFILTFSTLSFATLFIPLALLGYWLYGKYPHLSLLAWLPLTFIDVFSGLLLILIILPKKKLIIPAVLAMATTIQIIFRKIPFLQGPFHVEQVLPDLFSDLGGLAGVSVFIMILSLIGLAITWKKPEQRPAYVLLPILMAAYLYSTQAIYLHFLLVYFAAIGFNFLLERKWQVDFLKDFMVMLLIVSLLFSTMTYMERFPAAPGAAELNTFNWLKDQTPANSVIFTSPEQSYVLSYYALRNTFPQPHRKTTLANGEIILNSTYISITGPILEQHNVSYLFLTPELKNQLPADRGLLFLLNSEKFKLVHEEEGYEVWQWQSN
jgi:hypothetical protein